MFIFSKQVAKGICFLRVRPVNHARNEGFISLTAEHCRYKRVIIYEYVLRLNAIGLTQTETDYIITFHVFTINYVMKKFFSLFFVGLLAAVCWSCSDDDNDEIVIDSNSLPHTANVFLQSYFTDDTPSTISKDKTDGDYEVTLASGIKVEFDASGNWKDVEGTLAAPLPNQEFIPQKIRDYVAENYPSMFKINAISRDKNGYEVQLTDELELHFDPQGNFVRVDN